MSRQEVRQAMRAEPEAIDKSDNGIPVDFFADLGIFCYFRAPEVLEAVEFGGPASPTFHRRALLERPLGEIMGWFLAMNATIVTNDAGFRAPDLGVGFFAPDGTSNPDGPVKSVIVFERGFYERREPAS